MSDRLDVPVLLHAGFQQVMQNIKRVKLEKKKKVFGFGKKYGILSVDQTSLND